jgi:DNA-binding beta-propeller fold protein YncE
MRFFARIAALFLLTASALAHPGIGIVADKAGNVYYTDLKQVWRIDARGNKTVAVPNVHTHELYLDADGTLFGEHLWYTGPQDGSGNWHFRVWKRAPDGRITDVVPATEGFRKNVSLVRDAAGNMYAAGESEGESTRTSIRKIDPHGRSAKIAGGGPAFADGTGPAAGFRDIRWMAVGADQRLYIIDGPALRRMNIQSGTVTTLARDLTEATLNPLKWDSRHALMGVTADPEGNAYVACNVCNSVKKIGKDGRVTILARSVGKWSPTGVAISPQGDRVHILEYGGISDVRVRSVVLTPQR